MDGTAITEIFKLIADNPIPANPTVDLPSSKTRDCCNDFSLKVLADSTSSDELKNDVSSFAYWFTEVVASVDLELWDASTEELVVALDDNDLGTFYSYGSFVNDNNEKFIGYQLSWKAVLSAYGSGSYYIKAIPTLGIGGTGEIISPIYCLKQYTPFLADKTIRLEYYLNNIIGDNFDDKKKRDFGDLNWYNSLRLSGFFGFPNSKYESDYIQYNNGQRLYVENEQEQEFTLKLFPSPNFVHELMRTDVLQSDSLFITDYNSKNPQTFIQKGVYSTSDYSPDWKILQSKLATVEVKFKPTYNNFKKLRC